ncbi:acyl-CoA dehydrogenase family protein [Galbibacter sp. BG1]|uniref:acyl-CoA dehydrogenase family protein n=1 Tax=Galbibacter sp. BG1 TaxID=1170699 RepID=UPI0015B999BA|nr:acyl-CoA dehydrogenase family protein [Galbibacter sp. BG1]QLE02438.1 acyl-CoA dehydrogenase family protein [Galbibacter sp. BG1]
MIQTPLLPLEVYREIKEMTARFSAEHIRPIAEELDKNENFPDELYRKMGEQGLFGITVPESYGGNGLDVYAYAIIMEELSKGYASVADQCGVIELITTLLSTYGTDYQINKYTQDILKTNIKIAYCITESEAGSDVSNVTTTATKTQKGWVLNGSKQWIHNAPIADIGLVLARTEPELGHRGMSIFIVDLHSKGVSRGPKDHKMGQKASQIGALFFDDVLLLKENLLGELNKGFYIMMSVLEIGRVGIGALATGISQAAFERSLDYAKTRKQFGKPIAANQGIQWMLADMATQIQAGRNLVHQAALQLDNKITAGTACSMAKQYASDVAVKVTADAVQIFGGSGYIRGFEVERLYRDAKITQIYEGTNQIQRNIIAKRILSD